MPSGLRTPIVQTLSVLVPILSVAIILLAFQASRSWQDFAFTFKSSASKSTTKVMATKTPVFLCVFFTFSPMLYKSFTSSSILIPHIAFLTVV